MTETNNNTNNTNNDWQERECGALWKQKGRNQNFLSGHIEVDNGFGEKQKVRLVVFSNKHKTNDNHPDFRVYLSKDREATSEATASAATEVTAEAIMAETVPAGASDDDLI